MNRHRACDDFHRTSDDTRRRMLDATNLSRRQLIGRGVGAGLALYAAQALPATRVFEQAEAHAQAQGPDAPVLVSVFLPGGADLLDTLVPTGAYGTYADLRKQLKLPELPLVERSGLGLSLHPSLAEGVGGGIQGLYTRGQVGFLPGIDYANPDLSHFHSRHFWETGLITDKMATGWLGRWLDVAGSRENPLQGISLTGGLSPLLRSNTAPVAAVENANASKVWMANMWGRPVDHAMAALTRMTQGPALNPAHGAALRSTAHMRDVMNRLAPYGHDEDEQQPDPLANAAAAYPEDNALAGKLRNLAGMLSAPLGIRTAVVDAEGEFDTHDHQADDLAKGLRDVSTALAAFQADLEQRGLADRVLTFVWSEFGRRPEANGTGTDHGAGGVAWIMGRRARSGILSDYPSLTQLDAQKNLKVTIDFRRVYSSLLEQWLRTDANAVIPNANAFGRVQLIR